jgi:hypothetical protein
MDRRPKHGTQIVNAERVHPSGGLPLADPKLTVPSDSNKTGG